MRLSSIYMNYNYQEINNFFKNKNITDDLLINHIYPYAVQKQPPALLRDIRSFQKDLDIIESIYHTQYNPHILHTDLMFYLINFYTLNNTSHNGPSSSRPAFEIIYRRIRGKENADKKELMEIHNKLNYCGPLYRNEHLVASFNRIILGLFLPEERTDFINRYIIADWEETEDNEQDD